MQSQQVRIDLDEEAVQRNESKTKLVTLSWKNEHNGEPAAYNIVHLPLPYALPPTKYGPQGATSFHIVRLPLRYSLPQTKYGSLSICSTTICIDLHVWVLGTRGHLVIAMHEEGAGPIL